MPLSPEETAAQIAPQLDRLRGSVMQRSVAAGAATLAATGLTPRGAQLLAMLRATYPDRQVPLASWRAVFTYLPEPETDAAVADVLSGGFVEQAGDTVQLSDRGRDVVAELHGVSAAVTAALWGEAACARLLPLVDRVLDAALQDAGPTLSVMAPPYDRVGDGPQARLAERLTGLRFARYDAHVAAWTEAGLTATTVPDADDATRTAIEARTNALAGAPYSVLAEREREALVVGLSGLPD